MTTCVYSTALVISFTTIWLRKKKNKKNGDGLSVLCRALHDHKQENLFPLNSVLSMERGTPICTGELEKKHKCRQPKVLTVRDECLKSVCTFEEPTTSVLGSAGMLPGAIGGATLFLERTTNTDSIVFPPRSTAFSVCILFGTCSRTQVFFLFFVLFFNLRVI